MVLDDVNVKKSPNDAAPIGGANGSLPKSAFVFDDRIASPIDRLAAVIADFVLFWPVVALVIAPFTRQAKEAKLLGSGDAYTDAIISAIALGALTLVVYQTIFISVFGATPGKLFFRLRIVSIWNPLARPRPIEAFIRSLTWVAETLTLGLPWFAVFSNERRRAFHDRLSDCVVVALAPRKAGGLSSLPEMSIASGFQSAALAVFTLCVTLNLTNFKRQNDSIAAAVASREDEGRLCPEIREAIEETPGRKVSSVHDRLETALTLFETDVLDTDCLVNEADFALWSGHERPLAYLAKGLSTTDDSKATEYFDKACEGEKKSSEANGICAMTILNTEDSVASNDDGEDDPVEKKLAASKHESETEAVLASLDAKTPPFLRIAAIQHFMQEHNYEKALELVNSMSDSRRVGGFLAEQRTKALYQIGRKSDARIAMRSSSDLLDQTSRMRVAQWFCYSEILSEGCGVETSRSCAPLEKGVATFDGWLKKPDVAITYFRSEACQNTSSDSWAALKEKASTNDAKTYVEALALIENGKTKQARAKLNSLLEAAGGDHGAYFLESNLRLAELATTRTELAPVFAAWNTLRPTEESWQPLGQSLLQKLTSVAAWNDAIRVGLKLSKQDQFDKRTLELIVVAASGAGDKRLALGMLENIMKLKPEVEASRVPASVKNFEQISEQLLKENAP